MAKCVTTLVTYTCGQIYPLVETSHGQVWCYFRQDDLRSDYPRQRHLMAKCVTTLVRQTSCHMYPHPKIMIWVRLTFGQASGHADLWSDVSPKDIWWPSVILHQVIAVKKPHFVFTCWDN